MNQVSTFIVVLTYWPMKNLLPVFLVMALHVVSNNAYAGCAASPAKAHTGTSSRGKFMGIPGNKSGQH